jgi:hypothetical protein
VGSAELLRQVCGVGSSQLRKFCSFGSELFCKFPFFLVVIPRVVAPERRTGCLAVGSEFSLLLRFVPDVFGFFLQKSIETKDLLFARVCG